MSKKLQKMGGMDMMQMMQFMGNVNPPQIPQMEFTQGRIKGYFHNKKLEQMDKASLLEASISRNRRETLQNTMGVMTAMMTYSDNVKREFKRIEYDINMMNLAEEKEREIVKNLRLDGKLKQYQVEEAEYTAQITKLELMARMKAMEEEC